MQVIVERKVSGGRKPVVQYINPAQNRGYVPHTKPAVAMRDNSRVEGVHLLPVSETVPEKPRRHVYETRCGSPVGNRGPSGKRNK